LSTPFLNIYANYFKNITNSLNIKQKQPQTAADLSINRGKKLIIIHNIHKIMNI